MILGVEVLTILDVSVHSSEVEVMSKRVAVGVISHSITHLNKIWLGLKTKKMLHLHTMRRFHFVWLCLPLYLIYDNKMKT